MRYRLDPKHRYLHKHSTDMKNLFFTAVSVISLTLVSSCDKDDSDQLTINDLVGTYVGAMNVQNPDFTNAQYSVVVTKVSGNTVRISPSGSAGTEWTANLTRIAGVYTCLGCVSQNQITFSNFSDRVELTYNFDDNNEQFGGYK